MPNLKKYKIIEIRNLYYNDKYSVKEIAQMYSINTKVINNIVTSSKRWNDKTK